MAKLRVDVIAGVGTTSAGPVFQGESRIDSTKLLTIPKGTTTDRTELVVDYFLGRSPTNSSHLFYKFVQISTKGNASDFEI